MFFFVVLKNLSAAILSALGNSKPVIDDGDSRPSYGLFITPVIGAEVSWKPVGWRMDSGR